MNFSHFPLALLDFGVVTHLAGWGGRLTSDDSVEEGCDLKYLNRRAESIGGVGVAHVKICIHPPAIANATYHTARSKTIIGGNNTGANRSNNGLDFEAGEKRVPNAISSTNLDPIPVGEAAFAKSPIELLTAKSGFGPRKQRVNK